MSDVRATKRWRHLFTVYDWRLVHFAFVISLSPMPIAIFRLLGNCGSADNPSALTVSHDCLGRPAQRCSAGETATLGYFILRQNPKMFGETPLKIILRQLRHKRAPRLDQPPMEWRIPQNPRRPLKITDK